MSEAVTITPTSRGAHGRVGSHVVGGLYTPEEPSHQEGPPDRALQVVRLEPAGIRVPPCAQQAGQVLGAIGNARHGRRHQLDALTPGPAYAHGTAAMCIPVAILDLDIDDLVTGDPYRRHEGS